MMILCLDMGNSQVFGGIFENEKLIFQFRHDTKQGNSPDQLGIFYKSVLRENQIDPNQIDQIAISSVVPAMDYPIKSVCKKYFNITPFVLQPGVKTGIKIKSANPNEVGADLIATSIGAIHEYPKKPLIIVDFGTATTLSIISKDKEFLGAVITAGIHLSMNALHSHAAKLSSVEITKPKQALGRNTIECIQSGLYYSQLGLIREVTQHITNETFNGEAPIVIGTGGIASLFKDEQLFTSIMPNLILEGLLLALKMNNS